ncbi:hypothetical protein AVEN_26914-1 [Araneus ventricosus]|uniref:Uncharacterized protein n=1 Tax=Araneus ventricosus TaxID=182803 RepID=A0A4Y2VAM1_ARAVE|nr:hypothetical protein AVEN_177174-1 [Araneus ventricosus]GBO20893.1 hypothetical protein AVEN_79411-1 [Araneus ventricosus]GBO21557.1 hypothetical protein AVEN_16404-1 [Araneus ventricosus]GBO21562.1 hypothetical protein AVEN_26914-1 [Araneus ventricosus]
MITTCLGSDSTNPKPAIMLVAEARCVRKHVITRQIVPFIIVLILAGGPPLHPEKTPKRLRTMRCDLPQPVTVGGRYTGPFGAQWRSNRGGKGV